MFRGRGQVIYKPLRRRLLSREPTESSSTVTSFLMKSDRSFSSVNHPSSLLYDPFNQQNPHVFESKSPKLSDLEKNPPKSDFEKVKLEFDRKTWANDNIKPNASSYSEEEPISPPAESADELFKKMKETKFVPNVVSMVNGLCKDGHSQEALKLFESMHEKGTIPEVIIYTAIVEGFCKAQKLDDAIRTFRKMENKGIFPNAQSYKILIQWLCKVKRIDNALEFCIEMIESGHRPNTETFTGLVDGFCREKGLEIAKKMINSLRVKGFYIDEKSSRDYLEKKGPFSPLVWEAVLGKKPSSSQMSIFFNK